MRTPLLAAACAAAAALMLTGCGGSSADTAGSDDSADSATAATAEFPRTIEHAGGTTEITEQPTSVVTTSPSLAGTLLALDVPVTAIAATTPSTLTDDQGWFTQWSDVATERGAQVLYSITDPDLEAVELQAPDLIIASSVGADSSAETYDQLSEIAPTVMLDYSSSPWQDIAETVAEATGTEANLEALLADYDEKISAVAETVEAPDEPITLIAYQGSEGTAIYTADSPQAQIATALGFTYQEGPADLAAQTRGDISLYTAENVAEALGDTGAVVLVPNGLDLTDQFTADALVSTVPAVADGDVYTADASSFRIDYYSAQLFAESLAQITA